VVKEFVDRKRESIYFPSRRVQGRTLFSGNSKSGSKGGGTQGVRVVKGGETATRIAGEDDGEYTEKK